METREFLLTAHLESDALDAWIEAGWLLPRESREGRNFSEIDVARAQLIRDLQELGVNDDGIPIILDLVDQLHGLRRMMRDLLSADAAQRQSAASRTSPGISDSHWGERR